ncbi:MAG: hypothetical protein A2381_17280 [Bdellovibrionales bacterium RIFOXYB1_FULL_37_110]|nr:MAG: hypothetical protein A2181_08285 [Bdellovibrionales bacterium RIFOXYA1_FULL_38_20]OFZ50148.1 MAG: hypothetical protein A2417_19115 [Bdellovibrionales bacterium RIFOXYC1_FULL_37_79]OFZ60054.1 MAG: hypothetical protein A2381_17280 [Bdellovibrionales bacterium RIFOXYB1_FULL_37_110]OFZ61352.1 MAG: hypothetical protein A2577_00630 [Bdellovibrionales bacterium RIFOXYD1_FULL_36_51]
MKDIKKIRRSIKEIKEDMLEINKRRPTEKELIDLVKIINKNSMLVDKKNAIKRESNNRFFSSEK